MKRTAAVELDQEFAHEVSITKSWIDRATGARYVRGVASGVEEDRDGERISKNAIAKMAAQVHSGGVKLTSSHSQDWMTEMGEVVKAQHDAATDELLIEACLPPDGHDPIADKAWKTLQSGAPLGFSIGGKLKKAYYELREGVGKGGAVKRKVLDDIQLRHVMLTANPSYAGSFAEAVAKSYTDTADLDALPIEEMEEEVVKADPPMGGDSKTGDRDAGANKDGNQKNADDPASKDDNDDEDTGDKLTDVDSRHLACPNCGHEFAADLPTEDDTSLTPSGDEDNDNDSAAKKAQETDMSLTLPETLEHLRSLVVEKDDAPETDVEKDTTEEAPEAVEDVAKIAADPEMVLKVVAASHKEQTDRAEQLEGKLGEAFEVIAKAFQGINERLDSMPVGRKSVARVLPPNGEVAKTDDSPEARIEKAQSAAEAIKVLNEETYGIS